jgi:hypothetical protein
MKSIRAWFTDTWNLIQAWFTDTWKLDADTAARVTRVTLWLALFALLGSVLGMLAFAMQWADPNGLFWELVVRARKDLFKGFGDLGRSIFVLLLTTLEWWAVESSPMGRRWMIYHQDEAGNFTEPAEVRAAKKRNGVLVFIGMLVGNAIIFAAGR